MAKIKERSLLGIVAIFIVTLSAIAYQIVPSENARIPILLILPFVIWLASPDPVSSGGCINCRAKRSKQTFTFLKPEIKASNLTKSEKGAVEVEIGWDVRINYRQICSACNNERDTFVDIYVSKNDAPTVGQAILMAKNIFSKN